MPLPQHDRWVHKCILHNFVLRRTREYFWATCVLAPFTPTPTSSNTTSILMVLHLKSNDHFLLFLKDYELNQDFKLSFNSFKLTFQHMLHLLASGPSGMVFLTPLKWFSPKIFNEWIFSIILVLLSYHIGPQSILNCMYLWRIPPLNHDQAFIWNSPCYNKTSLYQFTKNVLCL